MENEYSNAAMQQEIGDVGTVSAGEKGETEGLTARLLRQDLNPLKKMVLCALPLFPERGQ